MVRRGGLEPPRDGDPTWIEAQRLTSAVSRLAATALLCKYFPAENSGRNACFLALGGMFAHAHAPIQFAQHVINSIYWYLWREYADYEQARAELVATYTKADHGDAVTGYTRLCEYLPPGVVRCAAIWLNLPEQAAVASGLPAIQINMPKRDTVVKNCITALQQRNAVRPVLFARDRSMVSISRDSRGRQGIVDANEEFLLGELERSADFYKVDAKGSRLAAWLSPAVVRGILARPPAEWRLPTLEGVVAAPVLRRDGTLLETPGYDRELRLYYAPQRSLVLPMIPEAPSRDQCAQAVCVLDDVFSEFPWVEDADRANYYALLFTPMVRHIVPVVPIALIDSPKKGTGKTLLSQALALVHEGQLPSLWNPPTSQDNWEKVLTTVVLGGQPLTIFDNIEQTLQSPTLSAVVTSSEHSDRRFHTQQQLRIPNRTCFAITGNNIRLEGDIGRRCYRIRIDARSSQPWEGRRFRHANLKGYLIAHRSQILAAMITMVRGWVAANRPRKTNVLGGGFEGWSVHVGGILAYAGVDGFLSNQKQLYEEADLAEIQWTRLLEILRRNYPEGFQIRHLTDDLESGQFPKDVLPEDRAFTERAGKFDGTKIAGAFRRKLGARFGERSLFLVNEQRSGTGALWRVETDYVQG
jgi:hypothetical protein